MDKVATLLVAVVVAVDQVQTMQDRLVLAEPVAREVVAQVASSVEQVAPMESMEPAVVVVGLDHLVAQVAQVAQVWYWFNTQPADSYGMVVRSRSAVTPTRMHFTVAVP
jgi:hypothetical protein